MATSPDGRRWALARPRSVDVLIAVVVGVVLAPLSLWVAVVSVPGVRATLLASGVVLAHVALAARRTSPLASYAVVCAAFAVQTAVTGLFLVLPSVVVFPLSLFSYCAHGRRPAPAVALVSGAAGAAVVTTRFASDRSVSAAHLHPDLWLMYALLLAIVVAAWSTGLFRRTQLAHVTVLQERARRAEADRERRARQAVADERARIAREIHDIVAHGLSVIVSQAKGGRYAPDRAGEALATIENTGRQALNDMRGLLGVLRTEAATDRGPQPGLEELPDLLESVRAAGLPIERTEHGTPRRLGSAAELAAFRTVQEALTNTIRHAGPHVRATVRFTWAAEHLTVTVSDDGNGPAASDGTGHGLIGMRERLAVVGGSLSAGPGEHGGFVTTARLPYPARSVDEGAA